MEIPITPLEITVGKTYAASIIGRRDAHRHPSTVLETIPRVATDHLIYTLEYPSLQPGGVQAQVMVSTNKTPKYGTRDGGRGIRSWRYQDVAIMVRGSDQRAVKEYANSLAEVLGVYAEIEGKGRYIIPLYRFLVGDGIVDREAEQKVRAALAPKITAKTTSGRKERRLKFPPEKKVDTGRLPWLR